LDTDVTQKVVRAKYEPRGEKSVTEPPIPPSLPGGITSTPPLLPNVVPSKKVKRARSRLFSKRDVANAQTVQEQCRQLCLSVFFRQHAPVRSLGFTSSIGGEGKSFLAMVTSRVLEMDSNDPVTLLDCNWSHPSLHASFGCPPVPGLAEWLRGECSETAIRYRVGRNLTFIPAGNGKQDAVRLLHYMRQKGLRDVLGHPNDLLIVDLPAIVSTAYGSLAASLVESLIFVVHAGVIPEALLAEAYTQIIDLPVQGVVLNQQESRIPRWIRSLL
jgi:Mrp family chromosome partitioning ATPase